MTARRPLLRLALGAAALAALLSAAPRGLAHPPEGHEARLRDRERYFQPLEPRPAPDFTLEDAEGRWLGLADLRGKAVVLHFVYASCPDVCSSHAERIADIRQMLNRTPVRDLVRFITVTTDPERDTPEVLRGYGPAHGLDPANWIFLTSGTDRPEATRALAAAFGHRFTPTPEGMQMHGVVTHVIDREGRLRANFHGPDFAPDNLVAYVRALAGEHDRQPLEGPWGAIRSWLKGMF
ncbi:SCO family protein [Roseicella aerolata]|uniref:SCO family protein n=1 Tax=Roseicella aerolata TaxID=2883479 RepID=A0A9X1LAC5_9PROT|nr:SCO family protein [Roseicella aerolata]MCB4824861.1 SCO family protein [Roseicella aerolata]